MKKVFLDANTCFDYLFVRAPYYADATAVLSSGDHYFVSSLTYSHLFYHLRRDVGNNDAIKVLKSFRKVVSIAPVDEMVIDAALSSSFRDYEDAIQYYSAEQVFADVIITRNTKDYRGTHIPAVTPTDFLAT